MKKINVAVIGLGVGIHHLNFFLRNKRCNLVAVYDFDKKKTSILKKTYKKINFVQNENKIIFNNKIQLVCISSYDNFHARQIIKCVKNNKHIFVEKPLCLNYKEYFQIKKILQRKPRINLSSNFVLRNSPQFKFLEKEIKKKLFGKIYNISGEYNYGRLQKLTKGWRAKIPFYSVMMGGGIHIIDLAIFLKKQRLKSVFATGNKIITKNSKFKYYDLVSSLLKFDDDTILSVSANFGCVMPHHHRFSVYGSKKTFIQNYKDIRILKSRSENKKIEKVKYKYTNLQKTKILSSFVNQLIHKNKKSIVTKKEVLDSTAVCLAINSSLKSKKWEKIIY